MRRKLKRLSLRDPGSRDNCRYLGTYDKLVNLPQHIRFRDAPIKLCYSIQQSWVLLATFDVIRHHILVCMKKWYARGTSDGVEAYNLRHACTVLFQVSQSSGLHPVIFVSKHPDSL